MPNVGDKVTLKKKTTGETMTGTVKRVDTTVTLDKPIIIEAAGYNDVIREVAVPGRDNMYTIVPSGGKRGTRKMKKSKKTRKTRSH